MIQDLATFMTTSDVMHTFYCVNHKLHLQFNFYVNQLLFGACIN